MRIKRFSVIATAITIGFAYGLVGCTSKSNTKAPAGAAENVTPVVNADSNSKAKPLSPEEGKKVLGELAAQSCQKNVKGKTFEEFEKQVFKEKGPSGKYIVNGDTPIGNRKQLQEFFEKIKDCPESQGNGKPFELAVLNLNGTDILWNSVDKKTLSYCVSSEFGSKQDQVVKAMKAATSAWELTADVKFVHVSSQDSKCNARNSSVIFDVNPVNVDGEYLARAFFPNEPRLGRNVLIDNSAFQLDPRGKLTLVGILRHELGHVLGFRHEQTRPEAGTCFEDVDWRGITDYDALSVMHYPQCNGKGDWSLQLTEMDKQGVACLYGPASGFQVDSTKCVKPAPGEPNTDGVKKTETFSGQRVRQGEERGYGAFSIVPNSLLTVTMTGNRKAGDPDLYVRFNEKPNRIEGKFSCRPYLPGGDEKCALDVPSFEGKAFVMVHGFSAGNYNLRVEYVKPQ
jgi:serine protease